MPLSPTFIYANYIEAGLWIVLAIVVIVKSRDRGGAILAITLLLFGISDIVETRTGAWYRPWWLLVWKAVCVAIVLGCGVVWRRRRNRAENQDLTR